MNICSISSLSVLRNLFRNKIFEKMMWIGSGEPKHTSTLQLLRGAISSTLGYIYISWGEKILFLHKIQILHVCHYKFSKFLRCNCNEEDWQSRHGQNIWGPGPWHATGIQRPFITLDGLFKGYFSSRHLLRHVIINSDFKLFFRQTILMSAKSSVEILIKIRKPWAVWRIQRLTYATW